MLPPRFSPYRAPRSEIRERDGLIDGFVTVRMVALTLLLLPGCFTADPGVYPHRLPRPPAADADRIIGDVRTLADDIGPRSPVTPRSLDAAAAHLESELTRVGYAVARQLAHQDRNGRYQNLIVSCGPAAAPRFVFGAHYDSHPDTPGADDNASGTAVLLELARLLKADPRPCQTVRHDLVFYTLEEPPYFRTSSMGSAIHARSLRRDNSIVLGMVSVEMVGTFDDTPGSQGFPASVMKMRYPDTGNFLAVIGQPSDGDLVDEVTAALSVDQRLPIYGGTAPAEIPGVDFSDHLNYWAEDMTAVMITDTAYLRTPHYHLPTDTPDRLDKNRMALLASGLWALALHVGNRR